MAVRSDGSGRGDDGVFLGVGTAWDWFGILWALIKIVIAVAVIVTDPLLVARGAHVAALSGDTPSWLTGPTVAHVVVLGVATVLSVFKPRGRTPFRRTRQAA